MPPRPAPSRSDPPAAGAGMGRILAERMFSRAAGAALVEGNTVRLLRDAGENYPAWLDAIAGARQRIDFENYIFRDDPIGNRFTEALADRARAGIRVRVLLDWLGSYRAISRRQCRALREAGAELRFFNPPRFDQPLGWLSRNHRKTLTVDDEIGYVSGLCVGQMWIGGPDRRGKEIPPWRDTGVEVRGPAVADLGRAFAQSWAQAGPAASAASLPRSQAPAMGPAAGGVALRVIGSKPNQLGLYRFDQIVASLARETLWLTDAYFVGATAYVRALCDAARDGVDVRLLVPGSSDLPVAKALSRAGYRPLLEAGIRVFEWNGPMLHAKTAVADGRWARIGSSNLNLASWIGNWELDVAIEDEEFCREMESMFRRDLENATEIVLAGGRSGQVRGKHSHPRRRGSPGRLAAGAVGLGSAVGAAITNHRTLGAAEAKLMAAGGAALVALSAVALRWPRLLAVPVALAALWLAIALFLRAWGLRRQGRDSRRARNEEAHP